MTFFNDSMAVAANANPVVYRIVRHLQQQPGWVGMGLIFPIGGDRGNYFPIGDDLNIDLAESLHQELIAYVRKCRDESLTTDMRQSTPVGKTIWDTVGEIGDFQGIIVLGLYSIDGSERDASCLAHILTVPSSAYLLWEAAEQILVDDDKPAE